MSACRKGDERPFVRPPDTPLRLLPLGKPFRWFPRHGDPYCYAENTAQRVIRSLARLEVYTAVVVTLCLIVLLVTR